MQKQFIILAIALLSTALGNSQEDARFSLEISTDSILLFNPFQAQFCLKNASGDNFTPPIFTDFQVVGGPSISTNMSIMNGKVNQKQCYTYLLEGKTEGLYYLEPATIEVDGSVLSTQPLEVIVLPNPDGIRQQPQRNNPMDELNQWRDSFFDGFNFSWPSLPPMAPPSDSSRVRKKKRKTTRI